MAKRSRYVCSNCGHEEVGWAGRCSVCGEWGTMEEVQIETSSTKKRGVSKTAKQNQAKSISKVEVNMTSRIDTGFEELNRVLGDGVVRDSVTMLTAKPGAGKSTLLLQVAGKLAEKGIVSLYVSGEESESQIKSRALRILPKIDEKIYILSTNSMDQVIRECERIKPEVMFLDSVQTLAMDELPQREGSPIQTVQVVSSVVELCKNNEKQMASFIVGHMTKADEMAGLRTLEHLVDTVIFLETGNDESLRLLRSTKNRFGYTGEIGLFQMEEEGLIEVKSPYQLFLTEREDAVAGSAISLQKEGSRLIPIEIEALVSSSYGAYPVRIGDSTNRDSLNTLVSILEHRTKISFYDKNVVLKVTGGIGINEKVCDLAIIASIVSSLNNKPLPKKTAFLAEVGLTGELKRVSQTEKRIKELDRMGFLKVFVMQGTKIPETDNCKVIECKTITDVFEKIGM